MVLTGGFSMNKKTTRGRKKIELKKIEENNSRQVTFSKRRTGLFKKASELCILTGAQVAVLVNSPGGRVYAFGHPNVDSLLDRYLHNNTNYCPPPLPTKEFNEHYVKVSRELEEEKKKRREMVPASSSGGRRWYEAAVDGMEVDELEQYLWSLVELKKKVLTRADELMMISKSPALFGGGSSVLEMLGSGGQMMGGPGNAAVHGGSSVFEMLGSGGQTVGGPGNAAVHGGSSVFEMLGSGGQTVGNAAVHGGFMFQNGVETRKF